MADLHYPLFARMVVRGAHLFGVLYGERHRLFLVNMLPGIERSGEAFGMQVLRRGDQHRVDVLILQHAVIVQVGLGVGRDIFGLLEALGVDIGGADAFDVFEGDGLAQNFLPARAGSDDAEADPLVRAQHVGCGQSARQSTGYTIDEITPRLHGKELLRCRGGQSRL